MIRTFRRLEMLPLEETLGVLQMKKALGLPLEHVFGAASREQQDNSRTLFEVTDFSKPYLKITRSTDPETGSIIYTLEEFPKEEEVTNRPSLRTHTLFGCFYFTKSSMESM